MGRPKATAKQLKKSTKPKKFDYDITVGVNNDEKLIAKDVKTKKTRIVNPDRPNNLPEGYELYIPDDYFDKVPYASRYVWLELQKQLTDLEFRVATMLASYGQMNTNSLKPLNDNVLVKDLAAEFNIGRNRVKPIFDKLFKLGVYAKVSVADVRYPGIENFWVLNPYLSFSGKLINAELIGLFHQTPIAVIYRKSLKLSKPKMKHIKG